MTSLDDFFKRPAGPAHPRLRDWKRRLENKTTHATLEVFRPKSDFGAGQPEMTIQFYEDGKALPPEMMPWDDSLDDGLIALSVKAVDAKQEAERFALRLRAALRKTERE